MNSRLLAREKKECIAEFVKGKKKSQFRKSEKHDYECQEMYQSCPESVCDKKWQKRKRKEKNCMTNN